MYRLIIRRISQSAVRFGDISAQVKANWHQDRNVKMLLAKAAQLNILKNYPERVYGKTEVKSVERQLEHVLDDFLKRDDDFFHSVENRELVRECLEHVYEEMTSPEKRIPTSTLTIMLAELFLKAGDCRLSSELIWCSSSMALNEFCERHDVKLTIKVDSGQSSVMLVLSEDMFVKFVIAEGCHDSFYTDVHGHGAVKFTLEKAKDFIGMLHAYVMTDETKKKLKSIEQ